MWLQVLQFLGVALFVGFVLYGFNIVNRWQNRHFPGPRPSWLFGNLGDMGPQVGCGAALQSKAVVAERPTGAIC